MPWLSGRSAPAMSFPAVDGLTARVDPATGLCTVFEVDAALGSAAVRRARTDGFAPDGAFGVGWRAEFEARVFSLSAGHALLVTRVQGLSVFVPTKADGVYVSKLGEVELLREVPGGYELVSALERVLRFDREGRLTEVRPGYRVVREGSAIKLVGDAGALTLTTRGGRVVRARGLGVDVRYAYAQTGLKAVKGTTRREYEVEGRRLVGVRGAGGEPLLSATHTAGGRVLRLTVGGRARDYAFEGRPRVRRASVTSERGTWSYRLGSDGWEVQTPFGPEAARLDDRGRIVATRRGGFWQERRFDRLGQGSSWLTRRAPHGQAQGERGVAAREGATVRRAAPVQGRGAAAAARGRPADAADRTTFSRDRAGRLLRLTTPAGRPWSLRYAGGRVVQMNGPMGRVSLARDAQGRVVLRKDASGRSLSVDLDGRGRVVEVSTGDAESQTFAYGEDGRSFVLGLLDKDGERRLGVFEEGQGVLRVETQDATLTYTHTEGSVAVDTPWGTLRRVRDAEGRVTRLESLAGPFRFVYDAAGRRAGIVYPNGVVTRIARDRLGREVARLSVAGQDPVLRLEVERGRRHARARIRRDGREAKATYDAAGRLVSFATAEGEAFAYAYDADGNLTSARSGERTSVRSYDRRGRLVRLGRERFRHDGGGRLVARSHSGGTDRFAYDGFGRLVEVRRAGRPAVRYTYDPLGRWSSRTERGRTVRYVYEGGRLLAELGPGEERRFFAYGPATDEPLAVWASGAWTFLHANDLGHVLAYTNARGERVASARFGPYGELIEAPKGQPVFFAGRQLDPVTGLVNMRARVYDPSLGRFLTPDPSGLEGGVNAYAYADGQPLSKTDPRGLRATAPVFVSGAPAASVEPDLGGLRAALGLGSLAADASSAEAVLDADDLAALTAVLSGPPYGDPGYVLFPGERGRSRSPEGEPSSAASPAQVDATGLEVALAGDAGDVSVYDLLEQLRSRREAQQERGLEDGELDSEELAAIAKTTRTLEAYEEALGAMAEGDTQGAFGALEEAMEYEATDEEASVEEAVDLAERVAGEAWQDAQDAGQQAPGERAAGAVSSAREAAQAFDAREAARRRGMGSADDPGFRIPVGIQPYRKTLGGGGSGGGGATVGGGGATGGSLTGGGAGGGLIRSGGGVTRGPTRSGGDVGGSATLAPGAPLPVAPPSAVADLFDGALDSSELLSDPRLPALFDGLSGAEAVDGTESDGADHGRSGSTPFEPVGTWKLGGAGEADADLVGGVDADVAGQPSAGDGGVTDSVLGELARAPGRARLGAVSAVDGPVGSGRPRTEDPGSRSSAGFRAGRDRGEASSASRGADSSAAPSADPGAEPDGAGRSDASVGRDADRGADPSGGRGAGSGRSAEAEVELDPSPQARPPAGLTFGELAKWLPDHDGEAADSGLRSLFGALNRAGVAASWVEVELALTRSDLPAGGEGLSREGLATLLEVATGRRPVVTFPRSLEAFLPWAAEALDVGQVILLTGQGRHPSVLAAERTDDGLDLFDLQAKRPVEVSDMLTDSRYQSLAAVYVKAESASEAEAASEDEAGEPSSEAEAPSSSPL